MPITLPPPLAYVIPEQLDSTEPAPRLSSTIDPDTVNEPGAANAMPPTPADVRLRATVTRFRLVSVAIMPASCATPPPLPAAALPVIVESRTVRAPGSTSAAV